MKGKKYYAKININKIKQVFVLGKKQKKRDVFESMFVVRYLRSDVITKGDHL